MKNIKIAWCFLLVSAFFILFGNAQAADSLDDLAPNTLYQRFFDGLDDIKSAEYKFLSAVSLSHQDDDEPYLIASVYSEGASQLLDDTTRLPEGNASAVYTHMDRKSGMEYKMDVIVSEGKIYIRLPGAKAKDVRSKWTVASLEEYEKLGADLGLDAFFKTALLKAGTPDDVDFLKLSLNLAKKHNLYKYVGEELQDGNSVKKATRYDLAYNRDAIIPFYRELSKSLTEEMRKDSIFSLDGFEASLATNGFVDYMANNSYVSLWFDEKTSMPVRLLELVSTPAGVNDVALSIKDMSFTQPNKSVKTKAPKKTITISALRKALDMNTDGSSQTADTTQRLSALLGDYEKARTKSEKADVAYSIAAEYDATGKFDKAAEYYRLSASNYKKGSVDQYEALAEAEWSLRNGAKAKEYFEKAYKKDPESVLALASYGQFLLGINNGSVGYQDLALALQLNEKAVSKYVNDSLLSNLYVNYLLIGNSTKAEALKGRFDNFESGANYAWIARAYHRMGNAERKTYYLSQALAKGYVQGQGDLDFFGQSFAR